MNKLNGNLIARAESAYDYQLLIKNLLFNPLAENPEQEIVYRGQLRFTYTEFKKRVCRLANALSRIGVKAGDTVAVMDYDSHRYLECFFAVPMLGAVLHTINTKLSPEQIFYTIEHAEDDILLVNSDYLPILEPMRARIDVLQKLILIKEHDNTDTPHGSFIGEYEDLLAKENDNYDFPDFNENTRATTFYTTGTTGLPKGVYFSHRQLVLHTMSALSAFCSPAVQGRIHRDDVYMPMTPMFHVHAWGIPYMATCMGIKQVYPGRYIPENLLELITKEKVSFSHCVPTILHMLFKHPHAAQVDFNGWRIVIGGAALPKALCLDALRRGIDIYTGYGLSETCPILSLAQLKPEMLGLSLEEQVEHRCKTGVTLPLVDVRIMDEDMNELPRDGESAGEIVVRAPWLTQGYLKDNVNSEKLWQGGFMHTGDVAYRDAQGYIKITDRSKDVIKVGGEWVSSLELEDTIARHNAVSEVAVISQPDEKWGERPLALVVLKAEFVGKVTEKDILHFTHGYLDKGILGKQVVLLKLRFVDALLRTSVGKLNKLAMRKLYSGSDTGKPLTANIEMVEDSGRNTLSCKPMIEENSQTGALEK
ncbi:MAG: fatty acid--CoA ligase [Deltaproteobacteria bacterium]|nr:fatty acid--CoA ligase [Deltaproteobacteria bacterium]